MLAVEKGVNLNPEAITVFGLINKTQDNLPIARRLKGALIDLTIDVGGVITLGRVAKVGRIKRKSLDNFRQVLMNPNNAVAVSTSINAFQLIGGDNVWKKEVACVNPNTKVAISPAGYIKFRGTDDSSNDDVLRLNVAKLLLDVVRDSSEMIIFHIIAILCLYTHMLKS